MKIVFSSVEEMFEELSERGIKEARLEAVVTKKTNKSKFRYVFFEFHVTAMINGRIATVLLRYFRCLEGLVAENLEIIQQREQEIRRTCDRLAKQNSIALKDGAFWDEAPFAGQLSEGGAE